MKWIAASGMRWTAAVSGQGNSSPIVWGDRIFLTTGRTIDGRVQLEVICLDRATGRRLWTNEAAIADGATHRKNGFASATPAADGERVFVSFGSAGLFCFDFEGRQIWRAALHSEQHEWGAAASPILFGGQVIQVCDQRDESFIVSFDIATGDVRWRTPRTSNGGWSTPVIVEAARDGGLRHELVVNGSGEDRGRGWVVAYDPATGAELWRVRGPTDVVCPTPVVASGLVISSSGRNGPILGIRAGGAGDVTSSHVAWKHGRGGAYVPSGVAVDNRLYLIRDEGALDCYDAVSGKRLWQERLRGSFTASLVAGDGKIYAASEQGRVYVIAAGERFTLLATNRFDGRILATPAIAGGEIFVRTDARLYCIARPSEAELADANYEQTDAGSVVLPTGAASAINASATSAKTSTICAASAVHGSPLPSKKARQEH